MPFQAEEGKIIWKVHFSSPIEKVFRALSTDQGRATFWAEQTVEKDGIIEFTILNYPKYPSKIIERQAPYHFRLEYFGTDVTFHLATIGDGGTDLTLVALVDNDEVKTEMTAGWVSVLMAMKAAVDFGVDLRNHHPKRVWELGYVDN
ncbi:MAG: hypothetical protein F6K19_05500 [Cyanothece sp. SIO1E1]|nr:hypothetical protein [Cyanothece sp. SIO1E1]